MTCWRSACSKDSSRLDCRCLTIWRSWGTTILHLRLLPPFPLSSVRQPRLAIGYRGAELLFDEIEANERDIAHEHQQIRFTPELVVRRSSAKSRDLQAFVGTA